MTDTAPADTETPATWTHEEARASYDELSDAIGEWQGLPVPLSDELPLVLNAGHPLREIYENYKDYNSDGTAKAPDVDRACTSDDVREDERIVNSWFSRRRNCEVLVVDRAGRRSAEVLPCSPDRSLDRLTMWMQTLGASDAWDLDAEYRARDMLRGMVTGRQWRHYDLTGSFLETSPRSQVTYVFRRLRPTIALSPRGRDGGREGYMLCIGVLCLHSIGYYARSWAGCLVPTDDVVAHLTMMRGDEAHFWGQANKHAASDPEAGL